MSDDTTLEEKSSGLTKLESLSQEELIKIIKNQFILKKKLETKIENENQQFKIHCQQLENELSIVRSSLINESQKYSCHSDLLIQSISIIIDLFQLPISLPDSIDSEFIEIYRNELEQKQESFKQDKIFLQQRIEDLEFLNEEIKLENDDLRLKSTNYLTEKQIFEKEIDNYRRQIEDFEEQFLELQRESHHSNDQYCNSISNQINDNHNQQYLSKTSFILSSDIPTLLHSIGITNCSDDEFTNPLNFESVLHLCTLLIERCRVLQYNLFKNNQISLNDYQNNISLIQNQQIEQCRIELHRKDHPLFDTIFERIYLAMNEKLKSNDWQIVIERSIDRNSSTIYLQFNQYKFVSDNIEHDLIRLRHQYEELSKENEQQRQNIFTLENRIHSHHSYDLLKFHQTQLEEQLAQQCQKTIQLENILQQANIDKIQFDRLTNFQLTYEELEEKYHIAKQLEKQFNELNKQYQEKIEFINKLQQDYQNEHQARLNAEERLQNQQNLHEENEKLQQIIQEFNQRQNSNENIQEFKEKYQKMKILLTRLKKELEDKIQQPKQTLIDLELADYEKTIENLKNDLKTKDKDLQDLHDELTINTEKYFCLKKELENLEKQNNQTNERANKFKELLDITKNEYQHIKDQHTQIYQNENYLNNLIQTLQNQLENKNQLIHQLNIDKQQYTDKFNNQMETNQKTIHLLEQNYRIIKHELDLSKQNYEQLQDDFNNYKIRAQSVLKQQQQLNQRDNLTLLTDKNIQLEEMIEKYKSTLHDANNKMKLLISENEALQKEQDRLIEIQAKLINESRKHDQELRKQHQNELNKIENECLQRMNESHELFKNVTLQNETISTAFKEQITTMEIEHERIVSNLQEQLRISKEEIEQLTSSIGIKNHLIKNNIHAWNVVSTCQQNEEDLQSVNNKDSPLNNSVNINEFERLFSEDEFKQIKIQLFQTNELLNESELNNQRLNEQISLLKDEIRRIERNMERAESISNLEYLKNVILKFFIFKSTPERLQLIPVLVTMLKLSPDEQTQLIRAVNHSTTFDENTNADESSSSQQISNDTAAASSSWSSYLNIW